MRPKGLYDSGNLNSSYYGLHDHDVIESDFFDATIELIDRRALEREGWKLEDVDAVRGEPFERALHPAAKEFHYPSVRARDGEVVQIVYVPVGKATKTYANRVWAVHYPVLYAWFVDDNDLRSVKCHGVVFIKSDF